MNTNKNQNSKELPLEGRVIKEEGMSESFLEWWSCSLSLLGFGLYLYRALHLPKLFQRYTSDIYISLLGKLYLKKLTVNSN